MKKVIAIVFMSLGLTTAIQAQNKVGHVNTQDLLLALPERAEAEAEVQKKAKELEKEIKDLQAVFEEKYTTFTQEQETMSPTIRKIREEELMEFQQRIQERQQTAQQTLQKLEERLMQPMVDKVQKAIDKVAEAEKFNYVFDVTSIVYYSGGTDITDKVRKELGLSETADEGSSEGGE